MRFSSVLVGEESSKFGNEMSESDEEDAGKNVEGAAVFSSSWLPGNDSKYGSFFLFSLSLANSVAHTYTRIIHALNPCTTFFVSLLSDYLSALCFQDKTTYRNKKEEEKATERESHL